jgi:hypothetical protein
MSGRGEERGRVITAIIIKDDSIIFIYSGRLLLWRAALGTGGPLR